MRASTRSQFNFILLRSLGALVLSVATVGVLSGWALAQQPGAAPAAPGGPAAAGQKQPAQPAPPDASQPAETAAPGIQPDKYVQLPLTEDLKSKRGDISKIVLDGNVAEGQRALFEDYYKKYELARWTNFDQLNQLPDRRRDLRNSLIMARGKPVHDQLVALALDFLQKLARNENPETGNQEEYHPAARVNAMLAIGDLNSQDALTAEDTVPLPGALPVLLEGFTDANQIDAVRLAALLGLKRHAVLGIADAQVRTAQVRPALLAVVQAKTVPGRSPEGTAWLRFRAIDALGALKEVGPNNAVVDALAPIVADQSDELLVRCAAARALGSLSYPANSGLDAWQRAADLGQLASDACVAELARMEEEAKQKKLDTARRRPGMGPMGMPGYGGYDEYGTDMDSGGAYALPDEMYGGEYGMGMMPPGMGPYGMGRKKEEEKEDETLRNRRRLKAQLNTVMIGLTGDEGKEWNAAQWPPTAGVASLATAPPQSELVAGVLAEVTNVFKVCDEEGPDLETFRTKIENQLALLREAINKGPRPAPAEPPGPGPPAAAEQPPGAGQAPAPEQPAGAGQAPAAKQPAGAAQAPAAKQPAGAGQAPTAKQPPGAGQPAGGVQP